MRFATTAVIIASLASVTSAQVTIKLTNKLQLGRKDQTIELKGEHLAGLNPRDLTMVHIKDSSGQEVLAQAIDTDFDARHTPDIVVFQADFAPGESKSFIASLGAKQVYSEEQIKAHGRFVRERFDDFCWENDRIAHRMYGKAPETWEGEPLTSSTIDIWSKRTPRMVIDNWYMVDDYHVDHGEGADFYSAGQSRGIGGSGLWANNQLFVSKNFVQSRVLANGPIRVMFELDYEAFDVAGMKVSEVKRISLDGGSQLDHCQSTYKIAEGSGALTVGVGLEKVAGEQREKNPQLGTFVKWERVEKNAGMQGLAMAVDPKAIQQEVDDCLNWLVLIKADANNSVSYWSGFCWDKAGQFTDLAAWKKYVDEFAQGVASPIEISVSR